MMTRQLTGRLGLLVVAGLLLIGVAIVAAQGEGPNPNEGADVVAQPDGEAEHALAPEEMVGRSPNEGQLARLEPAPAENNLPLEAMVGRSPNGNDGAEADVAAPLAAEAVAAGGGTRFLVTSANVSGANADTSCPAGFHMANLYELSDVTQLNYANVTGAKARGDQGSGPVAGWWGWIRTGNDSSGANVAGRANCELWSSATAGEYGTLARLAESWTTAGVAVSPWQAQTWSCAGTAPVWCVAE